MGHGGDSRHCMGLSEDHWIHSRHGYGWRCDWGGEARQCGGCGDGGEARDIGRDVIRRLGEVSHVFSVTFFLVIADGWFGGGRGTVVVRQALNMEETLTLTADLLVLCTTIEVNITQGTFEIYRCKVCTILEDREEMER